MAEEKTKKDLQSLKFEIKSWESEFFKANQRKPLKEDIQLAASEIKDLYKKYWTLKKEVESQETKKHKDDDVWSEKLNKGNNIIYKSGDSNKVLEKFCNKIRQRSSDISDVKSKSGRQEVTNTHNVSLKADYDLFSMCDTKTDCDNTDLSDFDYKLKSLKPKKIVKIDSVPKKLKSVNILSSSIDLKNLEKKLSFENFVDAEWLERCSSFVEQDSNNHSTSPNSIFSNNMKKKTLTDSVDQDMEIKQDNSLNHFPSHNLSLHQDSIHNNSNNVSYTNLQNISENENVLKMDEVISSTGVSNCDISKKISSKDFDCYSSVNNDNIDSPIKNGSESALESDTKSTKRKLARTNLRNTKSSTHLERKMASGTLNENFVRINIKKKKFSRGHKSVNIKKLKWKKWKEYKKFGGNSGNSPISSSVCFKCGQVGHWAKNCSSFNKSCEQSETNFDDYDDAPLPTLEEVAARAKQAKENFLKPKVLPVSEVNTDDFSASTAADKSEENNVCEENETPTHVRPLYQPATDGQVIATPVEVYDCLKDLGYSDFRKGQEAAIMRILSGLSTLVVLPTGAGKSFCYQLPAYIYAKHMKCVTLVVSPLVSLMEDQVKGLPSCLHAICLHSGMTDVQKKISLMDLKDGKAQILLVSPEAVIGGQAYGSGMLPSNMPPIAFACIDEAHCLSQWSHNFRPSYLQLYKALTEFYNVKCILGLTATANLSTAQEIISHLGLKSSEESVIGSTGIPENLHISVSRDKDKDKALIQLLLGDRFSACASIIIYCIRRDETERLATLIRTCLQDQTSDEPPAKKSKTKKRNFVWTAEAYHAGLTAPRRRSVQKQFMTGKLRVIVATIAFGMGLDKRDVRAVIHYNLPKSFESYVQEIGRAGRDGLDSHCHLFLDNEGKDIQELQRFIYSNSTDRYVIRKLLKRVFIPNQCKTSGIGSSQFPDDLKNPSDLDLNPGCPKHEIAFSINESVQELDLKEENILTLLCYLELHSKKWVEVLPSTYSTCAIRCYGGSKQLRALASKSLPVAAAFAIAAKMNKKLENVSSYEFQISEVASMIGWSMGSVKRALKNLEWNDQKRKTGVIVEFSDLAFHIRSPCNLSDDELDEILDFLHEKVNTAEKKEIMNLKSLHSVFFNYSHPHYWSCSEEAPVEFSKSIKESINKYFDESSNPEDTGDLDSLSTEDNADIDISDIRSQIRDLIYTNNDQNFTGRAIARIFYGIGSPCFPSEVWGRVRKFWRCLLHVNFNLLVKLANDELKKAK